MKQKVLSDEREAVSGFERDWLLDDWMPPFGEHNLPILLEPVAVVEMAFEIEVVVDGRMDGGELLETLHSPETKHGPLPSS